MKFVLICILLLGMGIGCSGQLVRRVDYDAAFALQAGGETGILFPSHNRKMFVCPTAGLKMTFPFSRKWFLGCEINYSELKFRSEYGQAGMERTFHVYQAQFPLYVKYMLRCNKASVLVGGFGQYVFDRGGEETEKWNAGITIGYEHRILKHLHIMGKVNGGCRSVFKSGDFAGKKRYPVQFALTLSYDILRIGDCECD